MATTTTSGATRLRVRVLFADEVGRHVLRHRGFSGCWFLVPSDARIVGDLAYALVQEFDLAARCPAGVDLAIDGLHVPANQDICVVRDNDAVAVQCASSLEPLQSPAPKRRRRYLEAEDTGSLSIPLSPSLSSEDDDGGEEGEEAGLRRMMQHLRSQRLSLQRKGKAPKKTKEAKATKQFKIKTAAVSKPGKDKLKKKATLVTTKQSESSSDSDSDSDSSSSGSSSSDSSSDSSSSSSSEEDTTSTNGGAKKAVSVKRTPNSSQSGKGAQPKRPPTSGDGAKAAKVADADNNDEQKPRRQRRRQRRRRRDRNGNVNAVQEGASNGLVAAPDAGEAGGAVAETSSAPTVAEPRREIRTRFPQSKAHFRFDGANGEAIAASHPSDGSSNHRQTPAGLEKYGPSSSDGVMANGGSNSGEAANSHARHANGANEGQRRRRQPGGDAANASEGGNGFAPQRKKAKTHRDEMWKRPYEVLATVLDKPQDDAATSKAVSVVLHL